ncbi:MAG: NusG domain II-containing protein [Oscillospiraceae bacterium]
MSKQTFCIYICVAVFLLGIVWSVYLLITPHGTQVNIVQDGTILYTFDLNTAKDQTLEIEYEGRKNIVQLENGQIRMLEAECPDKTCVHMGWLSSGAMPIVCLPNHLSIQYAESENGIDAVSR